MINAKVTIFDDETGRIYEEDKIIQARKESELFKNDNHWLNVETYDFHFKFQRIGEYTE